MRTNEMYVPGRETERDFMLRALSTGAAVGYDPMGTTWAVYDEEDAAEAGVVYLPTPRIGHVALPDGNVLEWSHQSGWVGGGGSHTGCTFLLSGSLPGLLFLERTGQWSVSSNHDDEECYPTPTIPADRIEEMARELALVAA